MKETSMPAEPNKATEVTGPASAELCKALGINPDDVTSVLGAGGSRLAKDTPARVREAYVPKKSVVKAGSLVKDYKALELLFDKVSEYLHSKDITWWNRTEYAKENEINFLVDSLIYAYVEASRA
jgi:hypothetical protein